VRNVFEFTADRHLTKIAGFNSTEYLLSSFLSRNKEKYTRSAEHTGEHLVLFISGRQLMAIFINTENQFVTCKSCHCCLPYGLQRPRANYVNISYIIKKDSGFIWEDVTTPKTVHKVDEHSAPLNFK
jgi:hypothetical protein